MVVVGFMTEPKRFRFRLKPRGPWVEKVVTKAWAGAHRDFDKVMGITKDVEI